MPPPTPNGEPQSEYKKPTPKTGFDPKSVNAFAVNQLSRGGLSGRQAPNISKGNVPQNYQSATRRVTLALVMAPIAIVTSYIMWDRFVVGNERKKLVKPESED